MHQPEHDGTLEVDLEGIDFTYLYINYVAYHSDIKVLNWSQEKSITALNEEISPVVMGVFRHFDNQTWRKVFSKSCHADTSLDTQVKMQSMVRARSAEAKKIAYVHIMDWAKETFGMPMEMLIFHLTLLERSTTCVAECISIHIDSIRREAMELWIRLDTLRKDQDTRCTGKFLTLLFQELLTRLGNVAGMRHALSVSLKTDEETVIYPELYKFYSTAISKVVENGDVDVYPDTQRTVLELFRHPEWFPNCGGTLSMMLKYIWSTLCGTLEAGMHLMELVSNSLCEKRIRKLVKSKDNKGRNPLNIVMYYNMDLSDARTRMISLYPKILIGTDCKGCRPLDYVHDKDAIMQIQLTALRMGTSVLPSTRFIT